MIIIKNNHRIRNFYNLINYKMKHAGVMGWDCWFLTLFFFSIFLLIGWFLALAYEKIMAGCFVYLVSFQVVLPYQVGKGPLLQHCRLLLWLFSSSFTIYDLKVQSLDALDLSGSMAYLLKISYKYHEYLVVIDKKDMLFKFW